MTVAAQVERFHVLPIQQNLPGAGANESDHQVDDRRFPRARRAYQRDGFTCSHCQIYIVHRCCVAVSIFKADVFKHKLPAHTFDGLFAFVIFQIRRFEHFANRAHRLETFGDDRHQRHQPQQRAGQAVEIAGQHHHVTSADRRKLCVRNPGCNQQAHPIENIESDPRDRAKPGVDRIQFQPGAAQLAEGLFHARHFVLF